MHRHRLGLILAYICLLAAGWLVGKWLVGAVSIDIHHESAERVRAFVIFATSAFVIASAIPFVPGLEIGLGLMVVFGAKMALLIYASLVVAFIISYLVGRFVPATRVAAAFAYFGLVRARDLVLRMAPLDPEARVNLLTERLPDRVAPVLMRYRYLALVVLFNIPGNSVIGGGGGIAFTAGLSGLFAFPGFLLSLVIAAVPVPLFFLITRHFS